jgi:hypothetical protein
MDKMVTMVHFVDKIAVMLQKEYGENGAYSTKNRKKTKW